MAYKIILSREDRKQVWNIIKQIIRDHHSEIMNKSGNLRDVFYVVRDYLSKDFLHTGKITQTMFDFFNDPDAYTYFTQDILTILEREGYERPDAKPIGVLYWKECNYTIDKIGVYLQQIRGFIYVEKEGIASKIKKLSNYGWGIIAAQGQATREIRKLIKRTGKICLVIHDYDPDGEIIFKSIKGQTIRTSHLNLDLKEKAIDLSITDKQADFLIKEYNVPTIPLPKKHQGKWKRDYRIELSAFVVVDTPSGNSTLDFVIAEMKKLGLPLSLEPMRKKILFREAIKDEIEWQINSMVEDIIEEYQIDGTASKINLANLKVDVLENEIIKKEIIKSLKGAEEQIDWIYEKDMEKEILKEVPKNWLEVVSNE